MSGAALGNGRTGLHKTRQRRGANERLTPGERVAKAQIDARPAGPAGRSCAKITSLRRVRNCGTPLDPDGGLTLALTTSGDGSRSAGYSGLASCGSIWACPQCAAKIATRRADELSKVMRAVDEAGGSAFLLTLTMRHPAGDRLGLTREERARLRRLEENRFRYEAANGNRLGRSTSARPKPRPSRNTKLHQARAAAGTSSPKPGPASPLGRAWQADQELFGGLLGWAGSSRSPTARTAGTSTFTPCSVSASRSRPSWSPAPSAPACSPAGARRWSARASTPPRTTAGTCAGCSSATATSPTTSPRSPTRSLARTARKAGVEAAEPRCSSSPTRSTPTRSDHGALVGVGGSAARAGVSSRGPPADGTYVSSRVSARKQRTRTSPPRSSTLTTDSRLSADAWECTHRTDEEREQLAVAESSGLDAARVWLATRGLTWVEGDVPHSSG